MKQLVGQIFGHLVVIEELPRRRTPKGASARYFRTRCICGAFTEVSYGNLSAGSVKSCGCVHPEGRLGALAKTGAYKSWLAMKIRCRCQSSEGFKKYGARGINMCDRWMDFLKFFEDMGERPEGHSIERIDNSKGYFPGNCRWATLKDQANNQNKSVRVLVNGEWMPISAAAIVLGLTIPQVRGRAELGYFPMRKAIHKPAAIDWRGEPKTIAGEQEALWK